MGEGEGSGAQAAALGVVVCVGAGDALAAARTISAVFSAIMITGTFRLAQGMVGITEASQTHQPLDADDPAGGVADRLRVVLGTEAAGAAGVPDTADMRAQMRP